jgi:biopolymer transport protein ExbD
MKIRNPGDIDKCDPDMTPMIDVTFQLVIFFMLTLTFVGDDQSELIRLPSSELAKPVEVPWTSPITLQLAHVKEPGGRVREFVLVGGDQVPIDGLRAVLQREKDALIKQQKSVAKATIIIRADSSARTGIVQQLIEICQKLKFERFVLRAKEQEVRRSGGI